LTAEYSRMCAADRLSRRALPLMRILDRVNAMRGFRAVTFTYTRCPLPDCGSTDRHHARRAVTIGKRRVSNVSVT
jgi:hypothetical protein